MREMLRFAGLSTAVPPSARAMSRRSAGPPRPPLAGDTRSRNGGSAGAKLPPFSDLESRAPDDALMPAGVCAEEDAFAAAGLEPAIGSLSATTSCGGSMEGAVGCADAAGKGDGVILRAANDAGEGGCICCQMYAA